MTAVLIDALSKEGVASAVYSVGWYLVSSLTLDFLLLGILAPRARV